MAGKMKTDKEGAQGSPMQTDIFGEIQRMFSPWLNAPIWIPENMGQQLQRKGEALFATRDLPVLPQYTEAYMEEGVRWTTNNYLILGGGGGSSSWPSEFIYYLLRKPVGIFIQRPWLREEVVGARQLIEVVANLSLEATGLGLLGSRDLFILVNSTSAGTKWSHLPPETEFVDAVWQVGENAIDEALDFLNPRRLVDDGDPMNSHAISLK